MRLRTGVRVLIEQKGSDKGDTSTKIAGNTPEDKANLLIFAKGASPFEEGEDNIFPLLRLPLFFGK